MQQINLLISRGGNTPPVGRKGFISLGVKNGGESRQDRNSSHICFLEREREMKTVELSVSEIIP